MKVPSNILDFLNRADHVYGNRIGVVDEPTSPPQLGTADVAAGRRARQGDGRRPRRPLHRPGRARRDRLAAPRRSNSNTQKPYWVNAKGDKIFCLDEADSAADASAVHREAHGLVTDAIYEVEQG